MSRGRSPRFVSYADLAIERFQDWPLRACRAECPPGRALALPGLQIVHFHQGDLAEVYLTRPVMGRLTPALASSGRVDTSLDSGWAQVHLDTENDVFLLQSLVSLAIQANDPAGGPHRHTITTCPHTSPKIRQRKAKAALVIRDLARQHPTSRKRLGRRVTEAAGRPSAR